MTGSRVLVVVHVYYAELKKIQQQQIQVKWKWNISNREQYLKVAKRMTFQIKLRMFRWHHVNREIKLYLATRGSWLAILAIT